MRAGAALMIVLAAAAVAGVQEATPQQDDYLLVVGDQVEVTVIGHEEYSGKFDIPAGGRLRYAPIGYIDLAGRKLVDVAEDIQKRFSDMKILIDPQVQVVVLGYAERKVYLTGSVYAVVPLPVHREMRLLQVIATAGGWGDGDKRNVRIIRKNANGELYSIPINAEKILQDEAWDKNIRIMPEDMIYIPPIAPIEDQKWVYVLGNVREPGPQPWMRGREPITLVRLISAVGSFTQYARTGAIRIVRKAEGRSRIIEVDFDDIIDGKRDDVDLMPDDIIFVPESIF